MMARLIRRIDRYGERLSPRKTRPASPATVAAQSALPDYAVTGAVPPAQVKLRPNLDMLEKAA